MEVKLGTTFARKTIAARLQPVLAIVHNVIPLNKNTKQNTLN